MRKFSQLVLVFFGFFFLAACTTQAEPLDFPPTLSGQEGGLYPIQDLSLIGSTGRPQFLNIYANW